MTAMMSVNTTSITSQERKPEWSRASVGSGDSRTAGLSASSLAPGSVSDPVSKEQSDENRAGH